VSTLAWVAFGSLGVTLVTAICSRVGFAHLVPDVAVITVVFLAQRRSPAQVVVVALTLGYLCGRQALAPVGLHEVALILTALVVYFGVGSLAGSGARFFALTCGGAVAVHDLILYVLALIFGGHAHFASWPAASLVPSGAVTGVLALALLRPMTALEHRLTPVQHEALSWH